ncbi:MAG: LptF/LptG family permease [Bacteroidales bacterium]|nr:LptF/LptG family permease [Bacteroidales bacterium]
MKKIDIYIIKKFLGTYFLALFLIICVAVIFDVSEKMDDFLDKGAPMKSIIFDYYLNFIPYFANLFSALFVFISVIFFTSRMASKTEFIAMFSSGISLRRLLVPYLIAATIITGFSLFLGNYVIPEANKKRLEFQNTYFKGGGSKMGEFNIHRQIEQGVYFYVESYNRERNIGNRMTLEKFEGVKLVSKLNADMMIWDSINQTWILQNYYIRQFEPNKESLVSGLRTDSCFRLRPEDFESKLNVVEAMNRKELNEYIAEQRLSGTSAVISSEIEKYSRIAAPFATFILTIIGFALSVRKVRGGLGINIGVGLLLSFSYILFMRFSTVFALSGTFNAALSVWVPNLLYTIIAAVIYFTAPK